MSHDLPAPIEQLIACPTCDALYDADVAAELRCARCHRVLITPDRKAGLKIILLALASVALVIGATTQPFLSIKRFFLTQEATLIETALAFEGPLLILSLATLALVLILMLAEMLHLRIVTKSKKLLVMQIWFLSLLVWAVARERGGRRSSRGSLASSVR